LSEDRLKIAVFVDFDNIEIGVRNTLNRKFDISAVLEAVKERGEIVTKVAYGDWKRSGDYGRAMGQHAIHMVQRNPTPGGDKNGADINLALDALEMAFTRDHINAFVIVGGDSDFITLVEKLKQYDKKVIVVGGRAFTSVILQKNCHEFIAYENLIRSSRKPAEGRARASTEVPIDKVVPLVLRAVKILNDREVSPQIGLLKSTLLQLDSTFSERDYGATTFRDFVEKLARKGVISLKHMDRSIVVEPLETSAEAGPELAEEVRSTSENGASGESAPEREAAAATPERMEEGIRQIRLAFEKAVTPLKWPMYLRGVRQLIKAFDPEFDETEYGFRGLQDALRQLQKTGFLRLDRNRSGVLRILPGEALSQASAGDGEADDTGEAPPAASTDDSQDLTDKVGETATGDHEDAEDAEDARAAAIANALPDTAAGESARESQSGGSTGTGRKKTVRKTKRKKAATGRTAQTGRARKTKASGTRKKAASVAPKE
jgi:uncharacterized LabA/DUF88 family protein